MALLAQKLNELSVANAEGLLTDDEYRLLRINAFERFSGPDALLVPTEAPVVPNMPSVSTISLAGRKQIEFSAPLLRPVSPVNKHKSSLAVGVANLIRKATNRKSPPTALTNLPSLSSASPSPGPLKRSFLPRALTRKPSMDVASNRSGSTSEHSRSLSSSHKASLSVSSDTFTSPPASPRTRHPVPSSSKNDLNTADDIFEDGGLTTTKQIRQAIMETEMEGKKVIEAFDGLELTARVRHQEKLSPRRPPLSSPLPSYLAINSASSPNRPTSPSSLSPERVPARQRSGSDVVSLRSVVSTPSISIVKSPTTRVKPPSSLQAYSLVPSSASLKRKNSVSSVSSQTHSGRSTRLGMSHTNSLSRSTSHLPLGMVAEGINGADIDEELADIHRRRQKVIDRYEARLEYLRARLKGAELHERLLRK